MATRIATVSGDWNNTATWGGNPVPVTGDWAQINGDVVVTIPTGVSAACARVYIGLTNNSTGTSTLIINGTLTMDASGQVRIGDQTTASRDGILIMGPGGILNGAGSIYFNQGKLLSTATKANKATIGGTLAVTTLATGPKQYVDISHISWQCTGTIVFNLQNTLGAFTSQFIAADCVFSGNAAITIGSTDSPNSTPISLTRVDIREGIGGKQILLRRAAGGSATFAITDSTVYQTSGPYYIKPTTAAGLTVSGCVLFNTYILNDSASGGMTITSNLFSSNINTPSILQLTDAAVGSTITFNYFLGLDAGNNLRGLVPPISSGGSGTNTIHDNILDTPADATHDKGDLIVARGDTIPLDIRRNIVIHSGEIVVGGRVATWSLGMTIKNNTVAGTVAPADAVSGHLYDPEGLANTGTVNVANNLHLGNGAGADNSLNGSSSGADQTIAKSDYNNFYGVTNPYSATRLAITAGNTGKVVPGSGDTAHDPKFLDVTRRASKWNSIFGSGTNTDEAATTYLAGMNGYRGTPDFDQNGTVTPSVRSMIDWVRYGFSPTNLALRAAGDPADGSPDKGAMSVRTKCPVGAF